MNLVDLLKKNIVIMLEEISKNFPLEAKYVVQISYNIRCNVNNNKRALNWLKEISSNSKS